jgi:hypothetical protein
MALVGYRFLNPLYHSDIVWNLFGSGKAVHELCTKGYAVVRQVNIYYEEFLLWKLNNPF